MPNFLSRLRSRSKSDDAKESDQQCAVQPVEEIDTRPPLRISPLPLVLPEHQTTIERLGWTVITFPQAPPESDNNTTPANTSEDFATPPAPGPHPLQLAARDLFHASQTWFSLPLSSKEKWRIETMGSEEGWTRIPGEKEFLALRTLEGTPDLLKKPAKRYWDLMGAYMDSCMGRLSERLGLPSSEENGGLRKYVGKCKVMQEKERTMTMLRLFRYEGSKAKVVAEPHADLGLLSSVVGNVPGLEVWGGRDFFPVEKDFSSPFSNATITVGRELEALSNKRFPAGGHRVVSYGPDAIPEGSDGYRYSIVFVLRAAEEVDVDTASLTTEVTGPFDRPVKDLKVGEWYERIRRAHFNINIGLEEREQQRRKIEKLKSGVVEETEETESR